LIINLEKTIKENQIPSQQT